MKKQFFVSMFLTAMLSFVLHLKVSANVLTFHNGGYGSSFFMANYDAISGTIADAYDEGDKPGKKKARKKVSRRKCVYCRPMREFEKGQWEANFSGGLVPTYLMDKATTIIPPLNIGAEYRINEKFSIGATLGNSVSKSQPQSISEGVLATWTNSHFVLGLRPGIHVTRIENWDFYGGFSIGLNYSNINGKVTENINGSAAASRFDLNEMEGHLGIRQHVLSPSFFGYTGVKYVINPKWLAHTEIGFGISFFSIGVDYLLN